MKNIFVMTMVSLGIFGLSPAQASFYPTEIEEICTNVESLSEEEFKCTVAQNNYLHQLVTEAYTKALNASKNKKELEIDWKFLDDDWKEYEKNVAAVPNVNNGNNPPVEYFDARTMQASLIVSLTKYAAAVLPKPKYSKSINSLCKRNLWECEKAKLKVEEKAMEANYKKALAKSEDKTALEEEQKNWLQGRQEICDDSPVGASFGNSGDIMIATCAVEWTRARSAVLAEMAEEKK